MRQTGRQAGEMGQAFARASDQVERAADRLAAAQIASRRATLAATEATERAERAQREAAQAAERLARGEIDQAEAARLAAHAERELERASIARATAQRAASQASAREADHQRSLAGALGNTAAAAEAGGRGLSRFSATASQAASSGGFPALVAALAALPWLAQGASVALTGGFGTALAGAGLAAAASADEVQSSFGDLVDHVKERSSEMAEPFERTLIDISGFARRTFDDLAPHIERSWARLAPAVSGFADKAMRSLEAFGPTIDDVTDAFVPLLDRVGDELPQFMQRTADAISRMSDSVDPETIGQLVDGLGQAVTVAGHATAALSKLTGVFLKFGPIAIAGRRLDDLRDSLQAYPEAIEGASGKTQMFGNALKFASVPTFLLGEAVERLGGQSGETSEGVGTMSGAMRRAAATAKSLGASMDRLAGETLSARAAEVEYEAAIDDARDSVEEHGRTLDKGTAKGRANRIALDRIATAALAKRDAFKAAGHSAENLDRVMDNARAQFVRTAISMGMSRRAANSLADSIFGVRTAVNRLPRAKHITITANTSQARAMFNALLGDISRRTVTIGVSLGFLGGFGFVGRAHGGIIGAQGVGSAQGGGPRGSWTLVGEQGAELVKLPVGSMVHPAGQTRSMLSGGGMGGREQRIVLELHSSGSRLDDLLVDMLRRAINSRGGNVQAVLGH